MPPWDKYQSQESTGPWAKYQPAEAPPEPGFFERVGADIGKRYEQGKEAARDYTQGKITAPEMLLASTGKVVSGSLNDIGGEVVRSAYHMLPDSVEQYIAGKAKSAAQTDTGQAALGVVGKGVEAYQKFAESNPRAARNIESVGNIAMLLPTSKAAQTGGTVVSKTGQKIAGMADDAATARKADFVQELVTPKVTPTVRADMFSRSAEKGILRNRVVKPSALEQKVIESVSDLPVGKSKSLLKNYSIISKANEKEAEALKAALVKNDVTIGLDDVQQTITNTVNELKKNTYVTGNGETAAMKVVDVMNKAILDNADEAGNITASGLLRARKDFDAMMRAQKGAKVFDPNLDGPASVAIQNMRQSINNLIESKLPDAGYKASLAKQSNLYRAMDAIESKGGYEGKNMVKRLTDKVAESVPGKSGVTKTLLGAAGLGAAAASPAAAAGGLAAYGAYKGVTNPSLWKALGLSLDASGKVLRMGQPMSGKELFSLPPQVAKEIMKSMDKNTLRALMSDQRGMFGGVKAVNANKETLALAQKLEADGVPPEAIWSQTGWFKAPWDQQWRFEISDDSTMVNPHWSSALAAGDQKEVTAKMMLEHPELYSAYPDAKAITVKTQGEAGASYTPKRPGLTQETIKLNSQQLRGADSRVSANDAATSDLLHELQHAIQEREGFSPGGNKESAAKLVGYAPNQKVLDQARTINYLAERMGGMDAYLKDFPDKFPDGELYEDAALFLAKNPERMAEAELVRMMKDNPEAAYRRLAGEAEARLVQKRMKMTPEQRRAAFPVKQLDVPLSELLKGKRKADIDMDK